MADAIVIEKTCRKCGALFCAKRRGACAKAYQAPYIRSYYAKNKRDLLDKQKIYKEKNKEKVAAGLKAWYEANKDRKRKMDAEYVAKHREQISHLRSEYYVRNKEKISAYKASYRVKSAAQLRVKKAADYEKNKERISVRAKEWARSNPAKCAAYRANRRARKMANGGSLSPDIVTRLYKLQRGMCACCGQQLGDDYHLDHRVPLSRGGVNEDGNMQLLRQRCNNQKHAKDPIEFMQERGFLI